MGVIFAIILGSCILLAAWLALTLAASLVAAARGLPHARAVPEGLPERMPDDGDGPV
jgi:hypothetical protein